MSRETPTIKVEGLDVAYERDGKWIRALRDANLSVYPDETLGLVGESGSGKTTLGLALVRYLAPNARISRGSIHFKGVDLVRLDEGALRHLRGSRITMVYQDPVSALNPSIRIGEQIAEIYRTHLKLSRESAQARSIEMLTQVRLPDAAAAFKRYPHEFSGGQQQRIIIAMALATNPDLMILDEPTTGLDATVEAEILDLFTELRKSVHASILFISHDITLIAQMCDRVGVLYAGQFVETGPTEEVLFRPTHPYTRSLLSCTIPYGATKADLRLVPMEGRTAVFGTESRGCAYEARCDFARDRCRGEKPALYHSGDNQLSRCFFHEEVRVGQRSAAGTSGTPVGAPTGGTLLELRRVSRVFRTGNQELAAVLKASFELQRGQTLGVVGESGSGKTTMARIIAGLTVPTAGDVIFEGIDVSGPVQKRPPQVRRTLQMVFQNPDSTLNPRHRVGRMLRRSIKKLEGLKGADRERRVKEILEAVRLERRHLEAFPEQLSGGQRQRVAIARAFAAHPKLVICDEPTSSLDVSVRASILNLLVDLQATAQTSYVFISHDIATVRYLADSITVMYLGEIVETGPANRVFRPPLHPYTESLLSAVRSLDHQTSERRVRLRGAIPSPINRPRGCPFHPRCPRKVGAICEENPPWQTTAEGHRYRCVIPPEELTALQAGVLRDV